MKTHVVVTFTGSKYEITAEQELNLRHLGNQQSVDIDGAIIKGSTISEVVPIAKYYSDRPNEERNFINYTADKKQLESPREIYNKTRALRAIKSMRQGLINQIAQSEMTDKKQVLLNKMDARIELLENTPEDKIHLTSQNLVAGYF